MDLVLGVSMTPSAVRMALVEGEGADGRTLDQNCFAVPGGVGLATSDAPERVVAAILGTREDAAAGGHRLVATGVAWTDHAAAARLRQVLRAQRVEDVVLVSELHAASALAQAVGGALDCQRTALLFLERGKATLAVVRAADGAVVRVTTQRVAAGEPMADLRAMLAGLELGSEAPQALFVMGAGPDSGVDVAALKPRVAALVGVPVHAPDEGELALARGAALAAANAPRFEAATVGLPPHEETAAGPTQLAAAGHRAPLAYSAAPLPGDPDGLDDPRDPDGLDPLDTPDALDASDTPDAPPGEAAGRGARPRRAPFALVGGAVSTVFVVGLAALAVSLAVVVKPAADQRPAPGDSAVVSDNAAPAAPQARPPAPPVPAPQTIPEPMPVVQEAPRTVYVTPAAPPQAPAPAPAPEPPAPPPPPAPAPAPPPAPAPQPPAPQPAPPVILPPIVIPIPVSPPVLPRIFQAPPWYPSPPTPTPRSAAPLTPAPPSTAPLTPTPPSAPPKTTQPAPAAPATAYPTYTPPVTTVAPSRPPRGAVESTPIWPPLWPLGG